MNWSLFRQFLSILIFLTLWALLVHLVPYCHQIPGPLSVIRAFLEIDPVQIGGEILRSSFRVFVGFCLGMLIGFPVGVMIGYSRILNWLLFPAFEMVRPVPPIAWIPLSVLFFVEVESQIVFLTFYGAFFPIVYNTISGISAVDIRLPRAAISFGVNRLQLLWKVIIPAAMPQIFTGMKVAIGITWLLVVAAEMMANKGGLGYLTWYNHTVMNYPMVIVGMLVIGICGSLSSVAVDLIGRRVMKWQNIF